jgi:hypothetical protein
MKVSNVIPEGNLEKKVRDSLGELSVARIIGSGLQLNEKADKVIGELLDGVELNYQGVMKDIRYLHLGLIPEKYTGSFLQNLRSGNIEYKPLSTFLDDNPEKVKAAMTESGIKTPFDLYCAIGLKVVKEAEKLDIVKINWTGPDEKHTYGKLVIMYEK